MIELQTLSFLQHYSRINKNMNYIFFNLLRFYPETKIFVLINISNYKQFIAYAYLDKLRTLDDPIPSARHHIGLVNGVHLSDDISYTACPVSSFQSVN